MLAEGSGRVIRWLHISDLHIVQKADWNSFERELLQKCQEYDKIDLVIVTGDFHNFEDGNDFHLAANFLQRLLGSLKLNMNMDLFVVPGNHDGVSSVQMKEAIIQAAKSKPFDNTEQWVDVLLTAFQDYETFVKKLIPNYPEKHPASVHSRIWRNRINFVHCNTALAADGKEKTNQLLDVDALAAATYALDKPNIILAHNNFFDLHQDLQRRVQDSIRINSICAYFCGDQHKQSVEEIFIGEDKVPCVVSYKGSPDPRDSYSSFGVIFGEWEGTMAELKGWCWESGKGFIDDREITGKRFSMQLNQAMSPVAFSEAKKYDQDLDVSEKNSNTQIEEYTLKRRFISDYYKLTYQQRVLFNQKHKDMQLPLEPNSVESELLEYVRVAQEKGTLENLFKDLSLVLANGKVSSID